jgi:hypothetical protein
MTKETTPPQTNPPTPPPLCCDCSRFVDELDTASAKGVPRCNLSQMVELVRGEKFFPACQEMRGNQNLCGFGGKFFERRKLFKPEIITP